MADWYVDVGQSGGNGTDPASAFPSITSANPANGDFVWIRRTHAESIGAGAFGPAWNVRAHARIGGYIGWPDVGDPLYERRPAAGVSAGWDSDLPATATYSVWGKKFPTLTGSTNNVASGALFPAGVTVANLCFNNAPDNPMCPFGFQAEGGIFDNILTLKAMGGAVSAMAWNANANLGKLWVVGSTATGTFFGASATRIRHIVIMSGSIMGGGLFLPGATPGQIGVIEILSNSVALIFNEPNVAGEERDVFRIERVVGTAPFLGVFSGNPGAATAFHFGFIDDYLGLGPVMASCGGRPSWTMATSAEGMHDSKCATLVNVTSVAASVHNYNGFHNAFGCIRAIVDVVSGSEVEVKVPLYVGTTNVLSLSAIQNHANLLARGAMPKYADPNSHIVAGSYSNWGGTLISGGSAWIMKFKFTPAETGPVPFEFVLPQVMQPTSGSITAGYYLVGAPYV